MTKLGDANACWCPLQYVTDVFEHDEDPSFELGLLMLPALDGLKQPEDLIVMPVEDAHNCAASVRMLNTMQTADQARCLVIASSTAKMNRTSAAVTRWSPELQPSSFCLATHPLHLRSYCTRLSMSSRL